MFLLLNPCVTLSPRLPPPTTSGSHLPQGGHLAVTTNDCKWLSSPKNNPLSLLLGAGCVLCPAPPRKSFEDPELRFQCFPILWEAVSADLEAALPQAAHLQLEEPRICGSWPCGPEGSRGRGGTTPADPVWFWESAQCNLPLTLPPGETEEQAWATLG